MKTSILLLGFLFLLLPCCGGDGQLTISLERPSLKELDPLADPRLSKFSLRISQGGAASDQETYRSEGNELVVGQVPVGLPFDLRLAGKTSTDEMLGLGVVQDLVIDGTSETSIAVKFRKPVGYVAGNATVHALNLSSSMETIEEYSSMAIANVTDVTAAPNGVFVLAAAGSTLVPIRTGDHQLLSPDPLPSPATCVAISPSNQKAVVCHKSDRSITVVDLGQVGSGQATLATTNIEGEPTHIAFGKARMAWILLQGLQPGQGCAGAAASQIIKLDLDSGQLGQRLEVGEPAADVRVDPRDGAVLLALPCAGNGALGRLLTDKVERVVELAAPRAIGVTEQNIVVIGNSTTPGRGEITRFDLANPGFSSPAKETFSLPDLVAYIENRETSQPGKLSWISAAQQVELSGITIAPDSQKALIAFHAQYGSDIQFLSCIYESMIQVSGYLVVGLASGEAYRHRFTRLEFDQCRANCLVEKSTGASLDNAEVCARVMRQTLSDQGILLTPEFEAWSSTILFGG